MTVQEIALLMAIDRQIDRDPDGMTPAETGIYRKLFAKYVALVSTSPGNEVEYSVERTPRKGRTRAARTTRTLPWDTAA